MVKYSIEGVAILYYQRGGNCWKDSLKELSLLLTFLPIQVIPLHMRFILDWNAGVGARFSVLGDALGWVVEKADWISRYFVCVCSIKLRSDGCIFCIKIVWRLFNSHSPYIFRFKKRLRFCCYCGTSLNDELRHNGKSNLFAFWIINFFALGAGYINAKNL